MQRNTKTIPSKLRTFSLAELILKAAGGRINGWFAIRCIPIRIVYKLVNLLNVNIVISVNFNDSRKSCS